MRKRKGSEIEARPKLESSQRDHEGSLSSSARIHHSLEDHRRVKKRNKENGCGDKDKFSTCMKCEGPGAVTAPSPATSPSIFAGRGLKRKIGCIGKETRMGRKNKIEDDFVFGGAIGCGKFGSVHTCASRDGGGQFACKTLKKGEDNVHREVEIMQHLSGHPGVVTLKAVYEGSNTFHLVMELCSGGRLSDQMAKEGAAYSEKRAAEVMKELALVIKYCHDMGVVHRDIKPENILLTSSGKMKLADFGLALRIAEKGQNLSGLVGSPAYVAPEVLNGSYCEKADIWSAGILLHALLIGSVPFQPSSLEGVFEEIKTAQLDFHSEEWLSISTPARHLLEQMLTRDATTRISADEILRHPWILFHTEKTLDSLYSMKLQNSAMATALTPSRSKECNDEYALVDVLAVAISHMNISAVKRSRLRESGHPMLEQHSSNLSTKLCAAF